MSKEWSVVSGQWSVVRGRQAVSVADCPGKIFYNFKYFYGSVASRLKHLESQEFFVKGHPALIHQTADVKVEWLCQSLDA
jgi:hypothetical protein